MRLKPAYNLLPIRSDPDRRPSPRRLRRMVDRWLPVGHAGMIARITVFEHGGHERPVITRGGRHLRFRYPSIKTQTTQLGEGKGERLLARYNEVAARIVDYEMHPFEITISHRGRSQSYRPDCVRMLVDGVELIEVKRSADDLADPAYRELLAAIAEVARLCGWTFRILHLADLRGPPGPNPHDATPRERNVDALFGSRSLSLTREEAAVADRFCAGQVAMTWKDLRDRFAPLDPLQGDAVIESLLARGRLIADLDVDFRSDTPLTPVVPFVGRSGIRP